MNNGLVRSCILLAAAVLAGCVEPGRQQVGRTPPRPVKHVDVINLALSPPTVLNWDNRPGADGMEVVVHLYQLARPLPVMASGRLEFLLYEGNVPKGALLGTKPFHTWGFEGDQLEAHRGRDVIGWGYGMRLAWGSRVPTGSTITLAARYLPPEEKPLYSAPVTIPLVRK